jgi:hypothetical protein
LSSRTGALLRATAGERRGVRSPKRRACPARGMPRPRRIETPRSRPPWFSVAHVAMESGREEGLDGRRARGAGSNVEVRKPQGAESHERRGRRPVAFTGVWGAGAGLGSGVKAWKPQPLGSDRCAVSAAASRRWNGRQGRVRREARLPGARRRPLKGESRGCQPGETNGRGTAGSKASGGCENLKTQVRGDGYPCDSS